MIYAILGFVIGFICGIWKDEIFAAIKKAGESVMNMVSKNKTDTTPKV